jgi:hypothetical protein
MRLNNNTLAAHDILLGGSKAAVESFGGRVFGVVTSGIEDGERTSEVK